VIFYSIPPADFLLISALFVLILHDFTFNPAKILFLDYFEGKSAQKFFFI